MLSALRRSVAQVPLVPAISAGQAGLAIVGLSLPQRPVISSTVRYYNGCRSRL